MALKPKPKTAVQPLVPINPVLDSTYHQNMLLDQASREQQKAGLVRQGAFDVTDTNENLRRLAERHVQNKRSFNDAAARNGSLYSGRAVQNYGLMRQGFQRQGNDMQDALARRAQQRQIDLMGIDQGRSAYEQAQGIENTQRATENAWNTRYPMWLAQQMAAKKVK